MKTTRIVEAVLFASESPLTLAEIARASEDLTSASAEAAIDALRREYDEEERAFQIYPLGDGYQILTRPEFATYLERFDSVTRTRRLSRAALETLAIVAYRQPVSRLEIEDVRGVNSAGVLRGLQERELIEVVGREEGLGRPLLYGTTARFLDHFGLRSLDDLPRPENLEITLGDGRTAGDDADADAAAEHADPDDEAG